jgi:RNA polymerase sigma-70 factor, ECF subfamily
MNLRELLGRCSTLYIQNGSPDDSGNSMADWTDRIYRRLLVVRCQVGDPGAFAELVAQCQPRLRAFLSKMLPANPNIDDIAQEVWMDVLRNLGALADPGAFTTWFYRIAHHRAFRMLRQNRRPTASLDDIDAVDAGGESDDFGAEDARAVHAAMDQLPPEHREALMLRFMEEMSYEQIAAIAGCPVGTVRSRIHNAKRALRGIIESGETS